MHFMSIWLICQFVHVFSVLLYVASKMLWQRVRISTVADSFFLDGDSDRRGVVVVVPHRLVRVHQPLGLVIPPEPVTGKHISMKNKKISPVAAPITVGPAAHQHEVVGIGVDKRHPRGLTAAGCVGLVGPA